MQLVLRATAVERSRATGCYDVTAGAGVFYNACGNNYRRKAGNGANAPAIFPIGGKLEGGSKGSAQVLHVAIRSVGPTFIREARRVLSDHSLTGDRGL